ncbi:PREDICTED: protein L-Myc isoform X2 [Nanorana parkeri]|uniref:protein L-Myc isoform X2 n=1 Tax=Nanorana parkeri TaxID=125878 RepID=UPI0008546A73|nr:PREDICTED: protein L-Myc isoform X2 [Nanorana parkeri]
MWGNNEPGQTQRVRESVRGHPGTMDLGCYSTHYFYDEDLKEDFYRYIAPSEDIWKKFELVPGCSPSNAGCLGGSGTDWGSEIMDLGWESPVKLSGLNSVVLLRDCMWSGFSTREHLEKVINERISSGTSKPASTPKTVSDSELTETGSGSADQATPGVIVPTAHPEKIPNSSGSENTSDSEDEIDVVTVEKRKSYRGRQPVTITVRADPLDTATKLFHISIHQQQHNYAARLPPEPSPTSPEPCPSPSVEEPGEVSCSSVQPCSPLELSSPPPSGGSDSEDLVKRKNHNYMERKRRNDLRSRFLALREEVPGLAHASKTPKVVVLSKASEYLQGLISDEQRLVAEKLKLRCRHQQLLKKLSQLKSR